MGGVKVDAAVQMPLGEIARSKIDAKQTCDRDLQIGVYLESCESGVCQGFGSGGEAEGLHFVRVLSLGEEFREDVALDGIQEKF